MYRSKLKKRAFFVFACILVGLIVIASTVGTLNSSFMTASDYKSNALLDDQEITSSKKLAYNEYASFDRHSTIVTDVEFSADDSLIASACFDGVIRVWNATDGTNIHMLRSFPQQTYYSVSFFPNSTVLASTGHHSYYAYTRWPKSGGCHITLWNLTSGKSIRHLVVADDLLIYDIQVSPDGKYVAAGGLSNFSGDSFIGVWNVSGNQQLFNMTAHTGAVQSIAYSPDGGLLASASLDQTVRIWNATNGNPMHTLNGHTDSVQCVSFSEDGASVVSGSLDKSVRIWDVSTTESISNLTEHTYGVWSVAFSNDGELVAAGEGLDSETLPPVVHSPNIRLWNTANESLHSSLEGHSNIISSLDFSSDDTILASGSYDWSVKLWGDSDPILYPADDWTISTPEDLGLNASIVDEGLQKIDTGVYYLENLVVVYEGSIVVERYGTSRDVEYTDSYHKYNQYNQIYQFSATKSVSSILFGIAMDLGYFDSVNVNVLDYFSEYTFSNVDSRKEAMTFEHLLTMTCGLFWNEDAKDIPWGPQNTLYAMLESDDVVQSVLDQPMVATPGEELFYNSGATQLLLSIIEKATQMSVLDFAFTYLFEPLGIDQEEVTWTTWQSTGVVDAWTGLCLSARNMAKIGRLMLNKGMWNGEQVVSEEWVENSTRAYKSFKYGYQWLVRSDIEAYHAIGFNDVEILVIPGYNITVASTQFASELPFVWNYIIGAILGDSTTTITPTSTTTTTPTTSSTTTTETTSTITTTPTSGFGEMMMFMTLGAGAIVVVIIVLVIKQRK